MKKAVLIVDDEFIILESLRIQISRVLDSSIILEVASSGEEARIVIEELKAEAVSLCVIISDFNLDDMKGTDVLKYAYEQFPDIKKAILTGQADDDIIKSFKKDIGLDAQFTKPWDFEELKKFIHTSV
jgi:DNA-binding NtrC family response regulator